MSDQLPPPSWPSSGTTPEASGASSPTPGSMRPPPPTADGSAPTGAPTAPPPPSGDPWSTPGTAREQAPDDWADGSGWAPPPEPPRRRSATWLLAVAVLVTLVLGGAAVGLLVGGDEPDAGEPVAGDDATGRGTANPDDAGATDAPVEPRSSETGDLTAAEAAAHRDLFEGIDASERTMIALNDDLPGSVEDLSEAELGEVRDAAGARASELRSIREDLISFDDADSDAVAAIRDAYVPHLDAWVDYAEAVSGDPTLLDRPDAALPYFDAINFTAEDFTASVATNLDDDRVPSDVADLAEEIVERGFSGGDDGTEI